MSRFRNTVTGVVVSVDDAKDHRYGQPWERIENQGSPPFTPTEADYESMKVDALKAEIDRRNTGRDEVDKLPSDGLKADLIAVLTTDDETASASN